VIGIIDYGVGNVLAFANMYKRMNVPHDVITSEADLTDIERIILPGVGSFDYAMRKLNESGLRNSLDQFVLEDKKPVLGICVGMQMLAESSDEGKLPGLGWVPGSVRKFSPDDAATPIRLPHMGWNNLSTSRDTRLLHELNEDSWFYYLHSYYFVCLDSANELASCNYGIRFSCAINNENIYGVQFHPEKSHEYGAKLLKNFAEI